MTKEAVNSIQTSITNNKNTTSIFTNKQTGPEAHPVSYTMGTGSLSPAVKRPGRVVEVKEEVKVHLY
jgi:hypothetical protein